jgi:hypothetical protein
MPSRAAHRRARFLALLQAAQEAYDKPSWASPYLKTSDMDAAWRIGQWLLHSHRTAPRDVRPARGDSMYHVNDMLVRIDWRSGQIERRA